MLQVIRSEDRGHANHGWLDSHHTFSFANYYNPEAMGFSHLRVINEDRVTPGAGFPNHAHQNMEIISYVLEGELEHKDSMGTGSVIRPGDVQLMSAGSGVSHSEFNASETSPVHFLQIWIIPNEKGSAPSYAQKHFPEEERRGVLQPVVSADGRLGSLKIKQDMTLYASVLGPMDQFTFQAAPGRKVWIHVATGQLTINGADYHAGDGISASGAQELAFSTRQTTEFLLFDLLDL